jgi:ferredoxin--NADP+ reductase
MVETPAPRFRVAIVGSGPSGFYAAEALLKRLPGIEVDMFDRLPTPFGLVRGGVAPDHPKIKQVIAVYDKIARTPGFRFVGHVEVGADITFEDLRASYHAVVLAYGASADRRLGIPGEELGGSHTATEFVGWYNGHPDYRDCTFDFSAERAVVIGQGNVAADVARILALPVDQLMRTDIAEHAIAPLAASRIKEICVIGRRGPAQAKFTSVELKELGQVPDCTAVVDPADLQLNAACLAELADKGNDEGRKNVELFKSFAVAPAGSSRKVLRFRFCEMPVRIRGDTRVEALVLARSRLEGAPFAQVALPSDDHVDLPCGLIFRSVGYKGLPLGGLEFDDRTGIVRNQKGRCLIGGATLPGAYVTGWIKRGPTGLIGTNRADSIETVDSILADLPHMDQGPRPGIAAIASKLRLRTVCTVDYPAWQAIDAAERERGRPKGKPREKFTRISDMLTLVEGAVPAD